MKIVFTGGGSGGHFYPLIAVVEAVNDLVKEQKILPPRLYYMAPEPYDVAALYDHGLEFVRVPAGKIRRYFSLKNFSDAIKTLAGCFLAVWKMYLIYPDVVFGKGGFASFPALFAAKILSIPVIIHESDSKPGRVNSWAGKFADKIALSYPSAAEYFRGKNDRIALTGNPIRKSLLVESTTNPASFFDLKNDVPAVLILGGSQGAQMINDTIVQALPELVKAFEIIHQTGKNNFDEIKKTTGVILSGNAFAQRYHPVAFLDDRAMMAAASAASLVVSRAGAGAIFETAAWAKPAIIIPLPNSISHDQTNNALFYAKSGAASIIEENNLSAHVLMTEMSRIVSSPELMENMKSSAQKFAKPEAAKIIAQAVLEICLSHEN